MNELIDLSSPPALSPSLHSSYSMLSIESRRLFNKVFMLLWSYLVPFSKRYNVLYLYWSVDNVRLKHGLTALELSLLTYLYQQSSGGKHLINSQLLIFSGALPCSVPSLRRLLTQFKDKGYIARYSRDPSQPYLRRFIKQQKIYIQLTGKAIVLLEKIEHDLWILTRNTTLKDITSSNTKGQTIA